MPKGKHAAALFEVINPGKPNRLSDRRPGLRASLGWLRRPDRSAALSEPAPPAPVAPPPAPPTPPVPARPPAPPGRNSLSLDPDRHELSMRLTYTTAIIAAAAVCAAVALAYLLGRQGAAPHRLLLADRTTADIRNQPPQPSVLQVAAPRSAGNVDAGAAASTGRLPGTVQSPAQQFSELRPPATHTAPDLPRRIGLNYIIVQSYRDEKTANEMRDLLAQNGVPCTVEQSLPGWTANWYTVVTIQGFERISNSPEYDDMVRRIRALSERLAPRRPSFVAFDPRAYKWRKTG